MAKKDNQEKRDLVSILSNPKDKQALQGFIDEAVRTKLKIKDEQESYKVIREEAVDKLGIEPKAFNTLTKLFFDNNFAEKQSEFSELEQAIEMLMGDA